MDQRNPEQQTSPESSKKWLGNTLGFIWDLAKTIIIVAVAAFVIRFFFIEPFIVQGSSMEPSFHNLDYLLIEKVSDNIGDGFQRGSVVVFHPPGQPNQNYIKRIVGLPGENVYIRNNQVLIQNQDNSKGWVLPEPYLAPDAVTEGTINQKLETNEYFLLGDNRANSKDSRSFGKVNKDQIIGRAWVAAYSEAGPHKIALPQY